MVNSPAYITFQCVFDPIIIEGIHAGIVVEESQYVSEALFCVTKYLAYLLAEAYVIVFRFRIRNIFRLWRNVQITKPQE